MGKVRLRDLDPAIFLNKVGIGTDNPAEMLDVVGGNVRIGKTTNGRLTIENSSGTVKVQLDSNGVSYVNGGNFGIGTGVVGARLVVSGNSDAGDSDCRINIIDNDSTSGSSIPAISFRSGASTQIYQIRANDTLGLQFRNSSDATKIIFDNDGKVGIGSSGTLTYGLTVQATAGSSILVGSTNSERAILILDGSGNGDGFGGDYGWIAHEPDGRLNIENSHTGNVITLGGKVGIGTGSNTPATLLEISHSAANHNPVLRLTGTHASGYAAGIEWQSGYGPKTSAQMFSTASSTQGGEFWINVRDQATNALVDRLHIDKDGKVGIGTGSGTPTETLQVNGNLILRGGTNHRYKIANDSNNNWAEIGNDGASGENSLEFFTKSSSVPAMSITNDDRVRMGATDGSSQLNVGGDICLLANNSTADRKDGITEHAVLCNNEGGSGGKEFNLADITRDTASWGNSHYIVEIFAHYPSGGSYAKYFVYYAYSGSGVITLENPKGVNTTGYGVRLAGEQTVSGNIKRASIMVDLPAYGRATIRLTHSGVYNIDEWTSSNENLAGRIKYNL